MEDGTVYRGFGFGARTATAAGEIVFNTAITGYQEVLTDPSYRGQIVTMTAPEIGNVGVNPTDFESRAALVRGVRGARAVAGRLQLARLRARCTRSCAGNGVAGITGIDTRAVTRRIRLSGAQRASSPARSAMRPARWRARAGTPRWKGAISCAR